MDDRTPEDYVSTPLSEAAAQLHEMFVSFVNAGFTENQALTLAALIATPADE